jgi:hypothetical protein
MTSKENFNQIEFEGLASLRAVDRLVKAQQRRLIVALRVVETARMAVRAGLLHDWRPLEAALDEFDRLGYGDGL